MSELDVLKASDIVLRLTASDDLLSNAGFAGSGDLERFIVAWGRHIAGLPSVQEPQACLLTFVPSAPPIQVPDDAKIAKLLAAVHAAQLDGAIIEGALDGSILNKVALPPEIRRALQGGMWTHEQASRFSSSNAKNRCFLLAGGRAVTVYVAGAVSHEVADASDMALESARDLLRRQGWLDGELLVRCGADALNDRSRRGIWEDVSLFVLRNAPELLIQSILHDYLSVHFRGYERIQREAHVPNEGRVDLLIVRADGVSYVVEIKWIGRSMKSGAAITEAMKKELKHKWKSKYVLIVDDTSAHNGVLQMSFYHKKLRPHKTYLAAYDCRRIEDQKPASASGDYPKPPDLAPRQYRIFHIPVDPRPASMKAR